MNKLKPIIILIIIILSVFCCHASAEVVIDERGNITASDVYDMSQFGYYKSGSDGYTFISYDDLYSRYVGVICLKSDEGISDFASLTPQEINDKTVYIGATLVDAEGNVSVSFRLPPRNGKYTVAFINKKLGTQLLDFEYENKWFITIFVCIINSFKIWKKLSVFVKYLHNGLFAQIRSFFKIHISANIQLMAAADVNNMRIKMILKMKCIE